MLATHYHIKLLFIVLIGSLGLPACDQTTKNIDVTFQVEILPHPKEIKTENQGLLLSKSSRMYSSSPELKDLLQLFRTEVQLLTGLDIDISKNKDQSTHIIFEIDSSLASEEYHLEVADVIQIQGGSYQAVAMAKTTLLQLATKKEESIGFPVLKIRDYPDATYRGLLLDVARSWHSIDVVKQLIDLAAFYKIRYFHFHLTDDQSFTFPTETFPKLPTPDRHYSKTELRELVEYAKVRGVTIIPELEVPGHALQFVTHYPELFGLNNSVDKSNVINMGKEEVYKAIDDIITEMIDIFYTSPYFHIGGDEANLSLLEGDPHVLAFMKEHDLGSDVHELFRYFIVRMNEIVKSHDKIMCVWEGFTREGKIKIPKDIIVFEFETNRYLPGDLIEDGYTVVNTSWKPIYVVRNGREDQIPAMWTPKTIYNWNIWRWENWWKIVPSYIPIQLEKTPQIIGAQMCAWEQTQEAEIPTLRKRLAPFAERVWNTEEVIPYETFYKHLGRTDNVLSMLIGDSRQDSLLLTYDHE